MTAAGEPGTTPEPGTEQEPGQEPETGGEETGETVPAFIQPTGSHDAYQTGEYMIWSDGQTYRCNTDDTVWGPDTLPDAWDVTV